MAKRTTSTAERIGGLIQRNVQLYTTDRISHERWSSRQTQLWALARNRRITEQITAIINRNAPAMGNSSE